MTVRVNSYRFTDIVTTRLVKAWIKLEPQRNIPWKALDKPLSECNVALISTGGIALKSDRPFDQDGERRNPWWGDPSFRVIPASAETDDIQVWHMHIDPALAGQDMNCLLPIDRLRELAAAGFVGHMAASHYSFMGYLLDPEELLQKSIPAIIENLQSEQVDVVALVPA